MPSSDTVTACSLTGSVPPGMTAAPGPLPGSGTSPYYCALSMVSAPTAAGQYAFNLQATDNSTPPQNNLRSYVLTIRPDFTFATSALAPGVQGRSYGVSPLSQAEATNIGATLGGLAVGNAPLTGCTLVSPSNLGLSVALDTTKTQCLLSSTSVATAVYFGHGECNRDADYRLGRNRHCSGPWGCFNSCGFSCSLDGESLPHPQLKSGFYLGDRSNWSRVWNGHALLREVPVCRWCLRQAAA